VTTGAASGPDLMIRAYDVATTHRSTLLDVSAGC
jgi:hypothetical protein